MIKWWTFEDSDVLVDKWQPSVAVAHDKVSYLLLLLTHVKYKHLWNCDGEMVVMTHTAD